MIKLGERAKQLTLGCAKLAKTLPSLTMSCGSFAHLLVKELILTATTCGIGEASIVASVREMVENGVEDIVSKSDVSESEKY